MDKIKRVIPFLLTALIVVVILLIEFTTLHPNSIDETFWLSLAVNSLIIVAVALVWVASGKARARGEANSPYSKNAETYSNLISQIEEDKNFSALNKFCDLKTEELRQKRIVAILASACIDIDEYDEIKSFTDQELKEKHYSCKQIKAINRVRNGGSSFEPLRKNSLCVKPIIAMELASNCVVKNPYDVHYNDAVDETRNLIIRILKSLIMAIGLALVSFELSQDITSIEAWAMFFSKLTTIFFTAWSSEKEGYEQIAVTKNQVILRRINFLNLFNEWLLTKREKENGKQ